MQTELMILLTKREVQCLLLIMRRRIIPIKLSYIYCTTVFDKSGMLMSCSCDIFVKCGKINNFPHLFTVFSIRFLLMFTKPSHK